MSAAEERVDHAAKARDWLSGKEGAESPRVRVDETVAFAAIAQAHATLALVEQLRIANLIALEETDERYTVPADQETREGSYRATRLRTDIKEALGL